MASAAIVAAFPACPAASAADAALLVAPELVGELTMLLSAVLGAIFDVTFVSKSLLLVHASCRCRLTASLPALHIVCDHPMHYCIDQSYTMRYSPCLAWFLASLMCDRTRTSTRSKMPPMRVTLIVMDVFEALSLLWALGAGC